MIERHPTKASNRVRGKIIGLYISICISRYCRAAAGQKTARYLRFATWADARTVLEQNLFSRRALFEKASCL